MKNTVIAILLLVSLKSSAQKLYSTHYFDKYSREVKTLEAAAFIREVFYPEKEGGNYKLVERFKNGKIKKTGEVLSSHVPLLVFDGLFEEYYPNGSLFSKETYKWGQVNGPATYYFDNGNIAQQGIYNYDRGESYFQAKVVYNDAGVNVLNEKGDGFFETDIKNKYSLKGKYKGGYKESQF